jgi:hypothetical protein
MLGGAYTVISLLLGFVSHGDGVGHDAAHGDMVGDAGHFGHTDVGAHTDAGFDHSLHVDAAHGDASSHLDSSHHADLHHGDHGDHGDAASESGKFSLLQYFSPMSVAGFLLGFGGLGVISRMLGAGGLFSTLNGMAGGMGLWLIAYLIIVRVFAQSGGTSHTRREAIIGRQAQVTAPIMGSRPGMICYTIAGTRQTVRAITEEGQTIPVGASVRIRRIDASTAFVILMGDRLTPLQTLGLEEENLQKDEEAELRLKQEP